MTNEDVDEVIRVLEIGRCSPARHAEAGCATCDAKDRAIATVRALASDRLVLARRAYNYGHVDGSSGYARATDEDLRAMLGSAEHRAVLLSSVEAELVDRTGETDAHIEVTVSDHVGVSAASSKMPPRDARDFAEHLIALARRADEQNTR